MTATYAPQHESTNTAHVYAPLQVQPRPRQFTAGTVLALVAVAAAVALLLGLMVGAVAGAAYKGHVDQRSICEQEGTASRFNSAC